MERTVGPQIIRTLNEMLEEERAAVEAVIGLASMATDPSERETLQRIGGDEVWACSGLRGRIEALGGTPSMHISDFANYVLSLEYFPERLRTFGRHQRLIMERIATLLAQRDLDGETKQFLDEMRAQHEADIVWCENRASVFETSRYGGEAPPPSRPSLPLPSMMRHQPSPAASLPTPPAPVANVPAANVAPPLAPTSPKATPVKATPPTVTPAEPPTPIGEAGESAPERPRRGRKRVTPDAETTKNNGADTAS
jgi:bacterioferritin (cytochrome b1)